jgi:alkylated DNA repair dioxygenase AlkB
VPEGFSYYDNFLTIDEEARLLKFIANLQLHPMIFQGFEAKRRVLSFGMDYSFDNRLLTKGEDIPTELHWLVNKVATHTSVPATALAELLITEYPIGSVINWHRDAPPFDVIFGISLLSDCIFKLRPHDQTKRTRKTTLSLTVSRRSLYIMSGVSRSDWQHCTAPVSEVRYSITLRTLKTTHVPSVNPSLQQKLE